jgi:hypothetical protein
VVAVAVVHIKTIFLLHRVMYFLLLWVQVVRVLQSAAVQVQQAVQAQ